VRELGEPAVKLREAWLTLLGVLFLIAWIRGDLTAMVGLGFCFTWQLSTLEDRR
jgi:hypothetical protein